MSRSHMFSDTYQSAREAFSQAAHNAGCRLVSHLNPVGKGPNGEDLVTDIACLGPEDKGPALIISSGTHGIEGYCGSAIQTGLLSDGIFDPVKDALSIYLVHAVNPHGFAYNRRVTEDNIDLNRNFIDFSQTLPTNKNYDKLHDALAQRQEADLAIEAYIKINGMAQYQAAVTGGQWRHADGLFYGGQSPSWSNKTWRQILQNHIQGHDPIAMIDIHTGLGPFGHGELICVDQMSTPGCARARMWYGDDITSTEDGTSASAPIHGALLPTLSATFPKAEVTPIALEFGTRPIDDVLNALRADNWLYSRAKPSSLLKASIIEDMRSAFYPQEEEWKNLVYSRALEIVTKAIDGLRTL